MSDNHLLANKNRKKAKLPVKDQNILVVEDSKSVNKILTSTFEKAGFHCFSSLTLSGAKEILKNHTIDYIMLDINLPDGSGVELIEKLAHTPEKIFVLTGETDTRFREISYQKGVIDFIVKDKNFFNKIEQIIETIEKLEKNRDKRVLVIDESLKVQTELKDLLQNRHYNVEIASDEKTALEIMAQNSIDLIILDAQLDNSNGINFLHKNRHIIVDIIKIPVLVTSQSIEASIIRDGLKAGAMDVIKKPLVIEEIVLKVDLWVDYKRKEKEVTRSSKLLEEYKDAVDKSAVVSITDPNGIITYVNDQFCELSGYVKDELLGKNHNIIRHEDTPQKLFEKMWFTIKELKKPWKGKIKNKRKDASSYWVEALINPILDQNGHIVEYIGIRQDITEHQQTKEYFKMKLQGSQQDFYESIKLAKEYEKAINKSNILSRSDLFGKITFVNDRFSEVFGYSKEEIIGKSYNTLLHPDIPVTVFTKMNKTIKSGEIFKGVLKNKSKNKETRWMDTTIIPIKNDLNEIIEYMTIRHDLTDRYNLQKEIEGTQRDIVYKMGEVGETRSKETGNHVKRVAEYSRLLAILYGLSENDADILFTASPMHDIGKVGIPDEILKKPGKLTDDEFEVMKTHAEIGYNVLKGSNRAVLKAAAIVSYEHHEKYNGKGYPRGLKGQDIHIYGRITAIADVYDALGSERCYKKAWEQEKIFKLFQKERGEHFDPDLIDLFFEHKEKFFSIRDKYKD